MPWTVMQNCVTEMPFHSDKNYDDPFNELELDVVFTCPDGEKKIPAFWAGGDTWKVRFSSPLTGTHTYRTVCSDKTNTNLHGQEGTLEVMNYEGANSLMRHGPLRVSENKRCLEHHDGTPFFWLGDTWWMGFCTKIRWPEEFNLLTADRVEKGFTLIQIVAGLYPDMGPFDPRGDNETGQAWEKEWTRVRPEYFDMADIRIAHLVDSGLVPCIVGCWGYYVKFAGPEALKKHWRYIVARWGAYPVVWCAAGELDMPWYLQEYDENTTRADVGQKMREQWKDVTAYLREIDAYQRPLTAHPGGRGSREMLNDDLVDIEMLQTGHGGHASIPNTVTQVTESVAQEPRMPVINGEVSYESIGGTCWEDVQRFMFWSCMLCGAAGHTYGANGIWQFNRSEKPHGPSPHGMTWGNSSWQEAYQFSGSRQVGIGRKILERCRWWLLEPSPDIVEPRWTTDNYHGPYAARVPGECVIVYLPSTWGAVTLQLGKNTKWHASFLDPATGDEYEIGDAAADSDGKWSSPPRVPLFHDLVLLVKRTDG